MYKKTLIALCMAAATSTAAVQANAQTTATMNKQQLVDRVIQLWHLENFGEVMLQQPAAEAVQQARAVMQGRLAPEKQEAAMKDITAEAKKFLDDASPVVRASTQKLVPSTVGTMLSSRFSEEELRQLIAMLESPVKSKFDAMVPELQKALGEKVAGDTRTAIDPKLQDLKTRINARLRTAAAQ